MTTEHDEQPRLEWTGERYVPEVSGTIRLEHVHRYLLAQELTRDRQVLDIACGEGYGSDLLAQGAARVVGVDIVPEVVQHASRRYRRKNLTFIAGSCAAIPLADHSVDVVVSFETLEHHDQHVEMMREVKRVLRPGGLLVISSPDRREYSDVPAYHNPFHVRELYRDEFEALLASHFGHVALAGQRIRAGSIVGPLDSTPNMAFISFANKERPEQRSEGMLDALYFIGVATDGPMPPLPAGLLDGGEFFWSADHIQAVRAMQERHGAEVNQLAHAKTALDARVDALKTELDRHMAVITALSVEKGRVEERSASFEEDVDRRGRRIEELEGARTQLEALADSARVSLEEARAQLAVQRKRVKSLERESQSLEQARASWQVRESALTATIAQLEGTCRAVEQKLTVIETSRSWRVTSPMRAARRLVSHAPELTRKIISDSARTLYRSLPLPPAAKLSLKDAIFRAAPSLVRHTVAYRAWQALNRGPATVPPATLSVHMEPPTVPGACQSEMPPQASPRLFEEAQVEYVPLTITPGVDTRIRAIAFYLPQFHPIPENDRWWGKGFTEWHNVVRGRPQFAGHYQPHLPGELGFYDLRLVQVQRRQIELAKMYGLHGFCYHHYWFGGTRLLRQPLDQLLANPDLDFPFCLCWANENWTRRWDGLEDEILIAQQHSLEDDLEFIRDIEPALRDKRYIHIDGRPLLIVYRPALLPDARETARRWRRHCCEAGIGDPFLVSTQAFDRRDPRDFGFDAAMEFPPNNMGTPRINEQAPLLNPEFAGAIYDYRFFVEGSRQYEQPPSYLLFRTAAPMWDNEPRRPGRGIIFVGSSPALYAEWFENACRENLEQFGTKNPIVFINAWNEWAEGAHLEPDRRYGYGYLQATADVLRKFPARPERPSIVVVSHDAYFHGAQRLALALAQTLSGSLGFDVDVLLCGEGPLQPDFADAGQVHDFYSGVSTPEPREEVVRQLYKRGARLALCNTSCIGNTVELLKKAGFTVVSMIHELPGVIGDYGLEASIATIAREADRVVFAAQVVRDRFLELTGMPPEKAVVRPQGLLTSNRFDGHREEAGYELRTRLGLGEHTRIVLSVGYADRRKGIDLFVDVGLRLVNRIDDLAFVWVGHQEPGAFSSARERVVQAGAEDRFVFPGLVENPDVFFAGADVYLMTSREDPFPLVVLDALDVELPTIGFDNAGGFVELLQRDCGILVPYLDTGAMAEALFRLLKDPHEGRRLGAVGKAIITKEFSFIDYARDLVKLAEGARPKISVIVPNYNYAHYLPTRLRSILAQTYRPHEIIFLDDCSSDGSAGVAEELLRNADVPSRIIRNETNQGVYRQWLRGFREATSDLVWIAEADDDCSPTLLETLVTAFADKNVVLAYCQSKQIDDQGRELAPDYLQWTADVSPTKWGAAYVRRGTDEIRDTLIVKNTIPNVSAVLMRKPDLSEIESQLLTLRNAGDWLVYVHLLERGDVAFFPQAVNQHRRHGGSVTIGHGGLNLMREILLVQRHILDRHPIPPEVERKREQNLQTVYEFLGLHADGPPSYKDHQALSSLAALAG